MPEYRPYKDTRVPIPKSQEEIKKILRELGATAVQITEVFEENVVRLRWKQVFEAAEGEQEAIIRLDIPMYQELDGVKTSPLRSGGSSIGGWACAPAADPVERPVSANGSTWIP